MTQQARELLARLQAHERGKLVSADEAVALIQDGDTLASCGFVGIGFAENLAVALERTLPGHTAAPRGLTLVYAAGQGDGKERGLNRPWRTKAWSSARDWWPLGPGAQASEAGGRKPH